MKGLLLKDWYAIKSDCRSNLFVIVLFSISGGVMAENFFFTFFPCIFAGVTAMSLIAYKERDKWEQYAATLPYTRAQMVSSKYIVSLCFSAATILLNTAAQIISMLILNAYDTGRLLSLVFVLIPFALLPTAFLLPFIFKFGVNKGRVAYYIVLAVFSGIIGVLMSTQNTDFTPQAPAPQISVGIIAWTVSIMAYALSWLLSIRFYKNREI